MAWVDEKLLDITQSPAIAGAVGALLSLRWMPIGSTWKNKFASLATGASVAFWFMPGAASYAGIVSIEGKCTFAFMGGLLGLLVLSRLWDYIALTPFGELLSSLFQRKPQQ